MTTMAIMNAMPDFDERNEGCEGVVDGVGGAVGD